MTPDVVIAELERYESELARILLGFKRTATGIYIGDGDDPLYRQYACELVDLYNDALGPNVYSKRCLLSTRAALACMARRNGVRVPSSLKKEKGQSAFPMK